MNETLTLFSQQKGCLKIGAKARDSDATLIKGQKWQQPFLDVVFLALLCYKL